MNIEDLRSTIETSLPLLFECTEVPRDGLRVTTPLMYPDGEIIDVHVVDHETHYSVTDFGETLGWLRMQTIGTRRSPRQNRMIEEVCRTLGIGLVRGQLTLQVDKIDALAEAVILIAQAALRISDLLLHDEGETPRERKTGKMTMIMGTRRVDYKTGVATVTDGQDIAMECEGVIGRITTEELQDILYRNTDSYVILGYRRSENDDGHVKSEWELVRGLCPMEDDEISMS